MNWKNIFKPIKVIRYLLNAYRRLKRKLKRRIDSGITTTKQVFHRTMVKIGYHSKPDFLIIGAQKAGTSALFNILKQHSLLIGSSTKEIHYFNRDNWYNKGKISDYHAFWPLPHQNPENALLFEATPIYIYHPHLAKRLYDYNPNLKLILILRNPAERALSAWSMYKYQFVNDKRTHLYDAREFGQAILEEIRNITTDNYYNNFRGYIKRGLYLEQISRYLKYFRQDQLLIIENKDLKDTFHLTMNRIFDFLDIPPVKLELKEINTRRINNHEQYNEEIHSLNEFFYPYNEELFSFLGCRYNWNDWKNKT